MRLIQGRTAFCALTWPSSSMVLQPTTAQIVAPGGPQLCRKRYYVMQLDQQSVGVHKGSSISSHMRTCDSSWFCCLLLCCCCCCLQAHPNSIALFVPAEITTYCFYPGKVKDYLVANAIFRMGGAGVMMTNKPALIRQSKYQLMHSVRIHTGQDDAAYRYAVSCL